MELGLKQLTMIDITRAGIINISVSGAKIVKTTNRMTVRTR